MGFVSESRCVVLAMLQREKRSLHQGMVCVASACCNRKVSVLVHELVLRNMKKVFVISDCVAYTASVSKVVLQKR